MLRQMDFVVASLVEAGLLSQENLERATRHAAEKHLPVPEAAVDLGLLKSREVAIARAGVCECPFVDLGSYEIDLRNAALLPRSVAERQLAFPLFNLGRSVAVGMADPLDLKSVDRIRSLLKADLEVVLCEPEPLRALIERAYSLTGGRAVEVVSEAAEGGAPPPEDSEPIVAAVNQILMQAIEQNVSDVHISPDDRELHLRYRIDGALQVRQGPPLSSHSGLVQRLKVMSNLDLTQTRRPQDGKFRFASAGKQVDVRVSIIPTVCGENVVLRLLASGSTLSSNFKDLGFAPQVSARLEEIIERPHGMVLVTGPTGSGKTTTLYTFLRRLNTPDRNLVTIEDPVEIRLSAVRQVQVNVEVGMTFAGALRSILRQDPDIILLGEIRDEETARIAVQAALTGHLVLSTLHTNDAPGALARLRDFAVPNFAINASLVCVLAQRLVRRVCAECASPTTPDPLLLRKFGGQKEGGQFRKGSGCPRCLSSGYKGRIGVYELLDLSPSIQEAVDAGASSAAIRVKALREGMRPLWQDGYEKASVGLTTIEEVVRIAAGTIEPDTVHTGAHQEMRLSA
ncbi:MAG: ATPase, T2SS/T4P/T4SS family [Phycisphaerales bacterium]